MLSIKTLGIVKNQFVLRPMAWLSSGPVKTNRSQEAPQDWEYCKLISQELKNKNVNAGLSLLFEVPCYKPRVTSAAKCSISRSTTLSFTPSISRTCLFLTQKYSIKSIVSTSHLTPWCTTHLTQAQLDEQTSSHSSRTFALTTSPWFWNYQAAISQKKYQAWHKKLKDSSNY